MASSEFVGAGIGSRVTVPPEIFAKLAAGGTLTPEEMATLTGQSATGEAGPPASPTAGAAAVAAPGLVGASIAAAPGAVDSAIESVGGAVGSLGSAAATPGAAASGSAKASKKT